MAISILVIDDDAAIRVSLSILLEAKGYQVISADDGAKGYEQFIKYQPDVVISDMIMPGHGGIDTIRKIRNASADVDIIAMSGSIQGGPASFLKRAQEGGANYCLEKPFETIDLLKMLAALGKYRA